ncbi:YitT family protein [Martelella alba]|uniref:YitT family protein n=1 Tax=Martelella alba TaxID=2590451 RepID=A0A506UE58_9HYPH|nr:YitT family protein [Martelella alba]TPW30979.1 YitT family protein [Martelella alba]
MANINAGFWNDNPARHTLAEDVQGILTGSMVAALGLYILGKAGLLTGGTAGLAFLAHYGWGLNFGLMFFLFNLPFYWLSFRRMGLDFTLKTFIAIAITSALTDLQARFFEIGAIHPLWGAVLGGLLVGYGLLALYRHRASLGGMGILAIYVQERFGIRAGLVQLAFDAGVMAAAFGVADVKLVALSVISAAIMNIFIAFNHRADRYIALR